MERPPRIPPVLPAGARRGKPARWNAGLRSGMERAQSAHGIPGSCSAEALEIGTRGRGHGEDSPPRPARENRGDPYVDASQR